MIEELCALDDNGVEIGQLIWDRDNDKFAFRYEQSWRENPSSHPLSLSLPLSKREHSHKSVESFIWGLLPDNDGILRKWGQRFHVSPRHPFQLLRHVGEECAGAIQFIKPDRVESWRQEADKLEIDWLNQVEADERIQELSHDSSAGRMGNDRGLFSLAGAQSKTAWYFDEEKQRWGIPQGNVPTTHILKPAISDYDGFAENEHFCLKLASKLGFKVPDSYVASFAGIPVFVVKRYDRQSRGGRVRRIHQEDFCQALSVRPQDKYQKDDGPGLIQIVNLLREHSSNSGEDVKRFMKAVAFNWLISGTDAHAKNYSILIAPKGRLRLAPLYDIASTLPYPKKVPPRKAKMAMKIGSKYRVQEITRREWEKTAKSVRIRSADLFHWIDELIGQIESLAQPLAGELIESGLEPTVLQSLTKSLQKRQSECRKTLAR